MLGTKVRDRVDSEIENRANAVFISPGVTTVAETGPLPFDLDVPNAETAQAIRDGRAGRGLRSFADVSSMFAALDAELDDEA